MSNSLDKSSPKNFDEWFACLIMYSRERDLEYIINKDDPESYREYYEDGDSVIDTLNTEVEYIDD